MGESTFDKPLRNLKLRVAHLLGLTTIPDDVWKSLPLRRGKMFPKKDFLQKTNAEGRKTNVMCCDADTTIRDVNPTCICYENYRDVIGNDLTEEERNKVHI